MELRKVGKNMFRETRESKGDADTHVRTCGAVEAGGQGRGISRAGVHRGGRSQVVRS